MVRLWIESGVTDDHADRDRVVDRTAALDDVATLRDRLDAPA